MAPAPKRNLRLKAKSSYAEPWKVDEIIATNLIDNGYKTTYVDDDGNSWEEPAPSQFNEALKQFWLNATPADEHTKSLHGFTKHEIYKTLMPNSAGATQPLESLDVNERAALNHHVKAIGQLASSGRSSSVNSALAARSLVLCSGEITRDWGPAEGLWVTVDDVLLAEAFDKHIAAVLGKADSAVFYGQFLAGRSPSKALAAHMAGALDAATAKMADKFKALGGTASVNGNGKAVGTGKKKAAPAIGAGTATADDVTAEATADADVA